MLFPRIARDVIAVLPTSSNASTSPIPPSTTCARASFTGFPVLAISVKILRSEVPAWLPFTPLFAKTPSMADVSSNETPARLAIGATYFMEFAKFSISNADVENDLAITSVTCIICPASNPNARKVEPATSAERAMSVWVAPASFSTPSDDFIICSCVNPNFAISTCSLATSPAVKAVSNPSFLCTACRSAVLLVTVPKTDASLEFCTS